MASSRSSSRATRNRSTTSSPRRTWRGTARSSSSTRRRRPAQRRAEGRVRELLPQRRRLPRDRLRDRDRARLAVLHRHPRHAGVRQDGVQSATIKVADRVHDASKNLPEYWNRTDAWYNFTANVRGVSHVLATVVEDPFGPQPQGQVLDGIAGGTMGADHPVAWCKDYQGGRSFYTAGGNTAAASTKPPSEAISRARSTGRPAWPTRSTATAARPCSRTTSSPVRRARRT